MVIYSVIVVGEIATALTLNYPKESSMKKIWIMLLAVVSCGAIAQDPLRYQQPSEEILQLVDVKRAPTTLIDDARQNMFLLYRDSFKSIKALSKKELRLAGLRIDPNTYIGSRVTYYNDVKLQKVGKLSSITIEGLPDAPRLANFSWSPNQQYMAMTHTADHGVELWVIDVNKAQARRLTKAILNANMGDAINWMADSQSVLVKVKPQNIQALIDPAQSVPIGPTVSVSDGKKAQNRTYQDLLKNKTDEFNFEQLSRSELVRVSLNGELQKWLKNGAGMYGAISVSPDGQYVLVDEYSRPFSYLVPYTRFPKTSTIYAASEGNKVRTIVKVPLIEDLPKGFMAERTGPRNIAWRSDKPNTLIYTEALDGGDPANDVPYRDKLMALTPPFDGAPALLLKTTLRLYSVTWGNDTTAIAEDYWWDTRTIRTYLFNPADNSAEPTVLFDRNYQDRYKDPGSPVTKRNQYGRNVLAMDASSIFLLGAGYSKEGQFPFLDKLDLNNQQTKRLYQSAYQDKLENLYDYEPTSGRLLVRIESKNQYPNYYFRDLKAQTLVQLTDFTNPFKSIENVHKEVLSYRRDDGLELSGTLYLPVGYQQGKQYPAILWAYPREYKDKSSAGQNTNNPNRFTFPFYGSPLYWVTKGYVVLNNAAFPIVGEGKEEPNDSFRTQLVANAKAAIDALDERGLIDRNRVAVGGHSYGAFMVANLLSHSDLFAAGIARSGAYNRTLTPFGFQSEQRNYWEAPDVYYRMSPFMHADKMKTPLLLIHGEADNNSGTYPMQSERYFNALKGLGATTRLVMLPKESHGYRAKESVLHMLWEQDQWLEKYVKNREVEPSNN